MTPVNVYLDVDGVVLPVIIPDRNISIASGWNDWRPLDLPGAVAYSPTMIDYLNALAALPHVHVHWCTTWRRRALDLARAVGLPEWPVLDADMRWDRHETEHRTMSAWWKRWAVQEHLPDGHRMVWVDDDLGFDETARLWVRGLKDRVLGITPETIVGITTRHIDRITTFVG